MKTLHDVVDTKLVGMNGVLFIGTQKGCAQAVKDLGLERHQWLVYGLNKFERARVQLKGKPMTGKVKQYFETHCM